MGRESGVASSRGRSGSAREERESGRRHSSRHSSSTRKPQRAPSGSPARESTSTAAPRSSAERSRSASASPGAARGRQTSAGREAASRQGSRRSSRASSKGSKGEDELPPRKWHDAPELKFKHRRTAGEIRRCKKGKRSDIKVTEWSKYGYAWNEEVLHREIVYDEQTVPIRRVKREDVTPEWFMENILKPHEPVIVEGALHDWPAMQKWCLEALEERFRQVAFKVAKDDKGKKMRIKFKYWADYVRKQMDDSPLYLFETNMDDNAYIRPLMDDYEIPDLFPDDWMNLMNNDSRPPFRWFCYGPKRSGTTVHTDPLDTAAWNAVTHGTKHWVLFHPKEQKRVVKGKDVMNKGEDDEAIMYFDFILPRIKKKYPDLKVYEGLQKAGDLIFVPGSWWHGVLNREDCVAVTQNYCGRDNFEHVWKSTRKEREKVAYLWLRNMKKHAPELYEKAMEMNREDNFKMRHERPAGEKLPDLDSSSSESSSDSSTDEAEDLDPEGLQGIAPSGAAVPPLGAKAFRLQGSAGWKKTGDTPRARSGGHRDGASDVKRRRMTSDDVQAAA
eukprot:TRINITY_DN67450_c0_g1_i1.p1 TRINITY_DN67450_c0_g1~~TRINITY_DN67450_c0_g1_i1.p1  ORF type:complete len:559 (+),score=148.93 TRINITY_DN67450_c0_g1_i1:132-1808(+)